MDGKVLNIEVNDQFRAEIKANIERVFGVIDKREGFLSLCDDILCYYGYLIDGVQEEVYNSRVFIGEEAMPKLYEAREEAIAFAQDLAERFKLGEIDFQEDVEVPEINFYEDSYKQLKAELRNFVLGSRSESRVIIKDAKKILDNKSLFFASADSQEMTDEYLDSVNFKYIASLNKIFGLAGTHAQVSDMVLSVAQKDKIFHNKQSEPGEEE